jgi:hypothetical protein
MRLCDCVYIGLKKYKIQHWNYLQQVTSPVIIAAGGEALKLIINSGKTVHRCRQLLQ